MFGLDVPFVASVAGLVWYLAMWAIGIVGCWASRRRYRCRPRSPLATSRSTTVPGVSILRPLKGLDANLYENLESTFRQEYPNYEILFSVADEHDQAIPLVRELIQRYPGISATIVIGEEVVDINPKVNNLMRSYRQAVNDILWVLDSNVLVDPGTLARSVDALQGLPAPGRSTAQTPVGLVHHVPFALSSKSTIGSRIEEVFLNTNHAKMYVAINTMALDSCVVGKSNIYRRSDLERTNGTLQPLRPSDQPEPSGSNRGLSIYGRFLAEDNMIGSALWHELGFRHDLSCDVASNVVENMSLSDYIWRRVRWIRVRKHMVLAATLVEPLTETVLLSAIASMSIRRLFAIPIWAFLVVHFTLWLYVDLDIYSSLAGHPLPADSRLEFFMAWLARETLALPIWFLAMFGNEVVWRGEKFQILRHGQAKRVVPQARSSWLDLFTMKWSHKKNNYETINPM